MRELAQERPGFAVGIRGRVWFLRISSAGGLASLLYYFAWWFDASWLSLPLQVLGLSTALAYAVLQLAANWYLYLVARQPQTPSASLPELSIDVFVTACGEPHAMIEKTLAAVCAMHGEHTSWLLDDGSDAELAQMAERMGAGYLARHDRSDAKAGNVNAALARTDGDIVVIFDADHVPHPNFLQESVGHFNDARIGFVQVMLTFSNGSHGWVPAAATESSLEYYNPTSLGSHAVGSATMMGSNALIRRTALTSIDGYRPGLAEDLATSIALHAAGWRSAYVQEPLAPGIAPPDLAAWFTQQMKWARGVFELLLTDYPQALARLTWGQRIGYAVRMTKYWIGPVIGLHVLATIVVLAFGNATARTASQDYLVHFIPLVLSDILIRKAALRLWNRGARPDSFTKAVVLVFATWPTYLFAFLLALLRIPLGFRHTPKRASGALNPIWLSPQLVSIALLAAGVLYAMAVSPELPVAVGMFALLQIVLQVIPCIHELTQAPHVC